MYIVQAINCKHGNRVHCYFLCIVRYDFHHTISNLKSKTKLRLPSAAKEYKDWGTLQNNKKNGFDGHIVQ